MSGKNSKLKAEIMRELSAVLGERDEGIRQSMTALMQDSKNAYGNLDFKITVLLEAMIEMGMTQEKLNEITNKVKTAITQQQGGQNENAPGPITTKSVESSDEPGDDSFEEGGSEHFGGD